MKAKEYAQKIRDKKYTPEIISQVVRELAKEIGVICRERNCQSISSINSVFKEVDQKYRAMCRILREKDNIILAEHGFQLLLQDLYKGEPLLKDMEYLTAPIIGIDYGSPVGKIKEDSNA